MERLSPAVPHNPPTASRSSPHCLLRARVVLPISRPPILDGALLISGERIAAVGKWRELRERSKTVFDLGEVVLLPGLINAHCHLDYTDMAGQFLPPRKFTDWIKLITTAKSGWTYSDFAQSWLRGTKMLLRNGTTTVADIEAVPELLPDIWTATPLRVFSFLEMTGVKSRRDPAKILEAAVGVIDSLPKSRCVAGLSPHAPYSTVPRLLALTAKLARRRRWLVTTHLAESTEEFDMFVNAGGAMFNWLKRNEREMSDCGHGSPVQHLERNGALSENLLAIHVNYLAPGDAELLSKRRVHVVHCPRSHDFFGHKKFSFAELSHAGVNICLGTDSLATLQKRRGQSPELNLFAEMRAFAATFPDVPSHAIVEMATFNAARALGRAGKIGELERNAFADVIAIPFSGKQAEAFDAVVHHSGDLRGMMIDGSWVLAPN